MRSLISARRAGPPRRGHHDVACTEGRAVDCWRALRSANVVSTVESAAGAVAARPAARLRPKRARWPSISARANGLVIKSAGFSVPRTLNKRHALLRTRSCTQSWATARCLTLPIPLRLQIPIAALLSAWTSGLSATPRSRATLCKPKISLKPFTIAPQLGFT